MGNEVEKFEKEFAEHFGSQYAVMVNSGSSANLIAVAAIVLSEKYILSKGDEVIVPAVSWSTTYSPLLQYGLKLRFVDIDKETLNISIEKLELAITKDTKAILAVNLLGNPNDYQRLLKICEENDLILIEDNCESMGAKYCGQYTGTFGTVGTYSTFFSHHITTMEGGVAVTNDVEVYDIMRSIRSHGWTRCLNVDSKIYKKSSDNFYESFNFILPGYNVRPIEMEAAIGRVQLQKIDGFLMNRRLNGEFFESEIARIRQVSTQSCIGESSYFGFPIIFENNLIRDKAVEFLRDAGVECRPIVAGNFTRNEVIKYYNYSIHDVLYNADKVHDCGLFIGNHHYDCRSELSRIIALLNDFLKQ